MNQNPNKFLTVLFSFIPGAGHMYFGLIRRGLSFMLAFAASIAGAGALSRGYRMELLFYASGLLIPICWFVAFFDFWRYPRMSPEEKALVRDGFLIPQGIQLPGNAAMRKVRVAGGVLLIVVGAYQLYRMFLEPWLVVRLGDSEWGRLFNNYYHGNLLTALLIITIGLLLIFWKSRQLKKEAQIDEK